MSKIKLTGKSKLFKKKISSINRRDLNLVMSEATECGSGINALKGFVSLPNFNSVSGDKEGFHGFYFVDGELVTDTVQNIKEEIKSFCNGPQEPQALRLTFDSIENANTLVGDASDVNDWNTFFQLPTFGNPFTSVTIEENTVILSGGSNIKLDYNLYPNNLFNSSSLVSIHDTGCIISVENEVFVTDNLLECTLNGVTHVGAPNDFGVFGNYTTKIHLPNCSTFGAGAFEYCNSLVDLVVDFENTTSFDEDYIFYNCYNLPDSVVNQFVNLDTISGSQIFANCYDLTNIILPNLITIIGASCFITCNSLTTVDLPSLTSAGPGCFINCTSLTTINIPSCTNLGGTVGDNNVFMNITGNTITLTVPTALMTADSGNPDGDIAYLQANNTVTIVTV